MAAGCSAGGSQAVMEADLAWVAGALVMLMMI